MIFTKTKMVGLNLFLTKNKTTMRKQTKNYKDVETELINKSVSEKVDYFNNLSREIDALKKDEQVISLANLINKRNFAANLISDYAIDLNEFIDLDNSMQQLTIRDVEIFTGDKDILSKMGTDSDSQEKIEHIISKFIARQEKEFTYKYILNLGIHLYNSSLNGQHPFESLDDVIKDSETAGLFVYCILGMINGIISDQKYSIRLKNIVNNAYRLALENGEL